MVVFLFVLPQCCPPEYQGFVGWHARLPVPWQFYSSIIIVIALSLVTFGSSLSVKGPTLLLFMCRSTSWGGGNPQNKHQVISINISSHNRNSPLSVSTIQVTTTTSSVVISKKSEHAVITIFPPYSIKGF